MNDSDNWKFLHGEIIIHTETKHVEFISHVHPIKIVTEDFVSVKYFSGYGNDLKKDIDRIQ